MLQSNQEKQNHHYQFSIDDQTKLKMASIKRKDEEGTELSVAKETQAQSAQSKFHREEKEGRGEGCTSEKRIW